MLQQMLPVTLGPCPMPLPSPHPPPAWISHFSAFWNSLTHAVPWTPPPPQTPVLADANLTGLGVVYPQATFAIIDVGRGTTFFREALALALAAPSAPPGALLLSDNLSLVQGLQRGHLR
ncbi:unnamed protein product, partial [Ixodes hexagonus]